MPSAQLPTGILPDTATAAPGGFPDYRYLDRPFTEYPNNPIVARNWAPHYNVSHVSSPHVLWNEDVHEMWLYFHGENTTTRLARSKDGITFTYDKVVLSTSMLPSGTTEAGRRRSAHETSAPRR